MIKNLPANAGDAADMGLIPGSGRSPGGGHGNPLHYSCLENPMDRGAWRAAVHGVAESWTCLRKLSTLYELSKTTPVKSLNHIPTTHISNKFYLFWSREKSFLIQCESLLTAHEAQGGTHPSQSARF